MASPVSSSALRPSVSASLAYHVATPTAHANLLSIVEALLPHPYRQVTSRTHEHDIRGVYLALTLNNASLLREPARSHVTLDHVDLLDDDPPFIGVHTEDLATLTFIFASNDLDEIILADMPRA
jgi:hypothetical protein